MIAIGFCILIVGIIGGILAITDKNTRGWGATRLKFVLGCLMCVVAGIVIVSASLFSDAHSTRHYTPYMLHFMVSRTFQMP